MVSSLGKKSNVFRKKDMGQAAQLLACSLQLNFKGEIKCLKIIKRLNLDSHAVTLPISETNWIIEGVAKWGVSSAL